MVNGRYTEQDNKEIAKLVSEHSTYADSLSETEIKMEYINLRANQEWLMQQTNRTRQKLELQESINRDLQHEIDFYLEVLHGYEYEGCRSID